MLKKIVFTLLIATQLAACTPTDKAALDQLNVDAATYLTVSTPEKTESISDVKALIK